MIHRPGLILAALLLSAVTCAARVQESQEAVTASAITAWTRLFAERNDGKVPETWPEYREFLKISINDIFNTTIPSRRYGVMSPPVPLIPPLNGVMLAVNRSPIEDIVTPPPFPGFGPVVKGPGRYVIFRDPAGKFKYQWMPEDYIVKVFAAAKQELPDPDTEPARPWVQEARNSMVLWRWVYAALVGVVASLVVWRKMGKAA